MAIGGFYPSDSILTQKEFGDIMRSGLQKLNACTNNVVNKTATVRNSVVEANLTKERCSNVCKKLEGLSQNFSWKDTDISDFVVELLSKHDTNHLNQWITAKEYLSSRQPSIVAEEKKTLFLIVGTEEERERKASLALSKYLPLLGNELKAKFPTLLQEDIDASVKATMKSIKANLMREIS